MGTNPDCAHTSFLLGPGGVDNFNIVITPTSGNDVCIDEIIISNASYTLPNHIETCTPNTHNREEQLCCSNDVVEGTVKTEDNEPVEGILVGASTSCSNGAISISSTTTNDSGYEIPVGFITEDICISTYCNDDHDNGVTTFDLVTISKHILAIQSLSSPYKMIAADANNSGSVSTLDLVQIRKLILFIDTEFSNNTSWRFIDANYEFPNPTNPWAEVFPEFVSDLSQGIPANFVAVKVGDVNESNDGTCYGSGNISGEIVGEEPVILDIKKRIINDKAEFDFKVEGFTDIAAYQMEIDFTESPMAYEELIAADLTGVISDYFGLTHLSDGIIRTLWFDEVNGETHTLATNEKIFSLKFDGIGDLTDAKVRLSSEDGSGNRLRKELNTLKNFAYDSEGRIHPIIMKSEWEEQQKGRVKVLPNPFNDQGFSLILNVPLNQTASVRIFDATGKLMLKSNQEFSSGENVWSIEEAKNWSNGIYFYEMNTGLNTISGKILKQ